MSYTFNPFTGNFDSAGAGAAPTSRIWLQGFVDFGTVRNRLAYFGNIIENAGGSDITLDNSAADGSTFTINTAGLYEVHTVVRYTSTPGDAIGIARNSDGLTNIESLPVSQILVGHNQGSCSFWSVALTRTVYLDVGDEVQLIYDNSPSTIYTVGFFFDAFAIQRIS